MFLFATTNGYATAGFMNLGPEGVTDPKTRETISFISGFALTFGISTGTLTALPFNGLGK
jgi:hypothetical protein